MFNFFLFSVVANHYKLELLASSWVYAGLGLGSVVAARAIGLLAWFKKLPERVMAAVGHLVMALFRLAFISLPAFPVAVLATIFSGFGMGLNAVGSQTLRRKLTTDKEFPEIVGLEIIIGKLTDFAVQTVCVIMASRGFDYRAGMIVSASLLVVVGALHLNRELA